MQKIKTVDEMKDALLKMARLDGEIDKAAAKRNKAITRVNATYAAESREAVDERHELEQAVLQFAEKNEAKICPEGKRSLELAYAKVSYRETAPKLELLEGWTWDKAVEAIKKLLTPAKRKQALRPPKVSVDKAGLKKLELPAKTLAKLGCEMKSETSIDIKTYPEKAAA